MDQKSTNSESVPFEIPEVSLEADSKRPESTPDTDATNITEKSMAKSIETGTTGNNLSSLTSPPTLANPVDPSAIVAAPTQNPVQGSGTQIKVITDDLRAADADLIEKAWVVKAKAIVEQTKDNPYQQTNEIKKIKADYQRKRFNSNLKIDDE